MATHPADEPEDEHLTFASPAQFEAWARENVVEGEEFVEGTYAGMERWRAWRAAGNSGAPPEYVRWRDYVREHPL